MSSTGTSKMNDTLRTTESVASTRRMSCSEVTFFWSTKPKATSNVGLRLVRLGLAEY